MAKTKRRDKSRVVLRTGESQRADGTYHYSWTDANRKRRYTFTTRMCEAGVNVKVIQDTLGHKDISTTLNIYTDVTKELRRSEFEGLDSYFKNEYNKANEVL